MKSLFRIWPWVKPYWHLMVLSLFGALVTVAVNLMIPLQISQIIDQGIAQNNGSLVRNRVLLMLALAVGGIAISALTRTIAVRMAFNAVTDLRRDLYARTQDFSFGNLDRLSSGELLTRLTSDITKVTTVLTLGVSMVAQTPIMFAGAIIAIVSIQASLIVVILAMVPVIGLMVWYVLTRSTILYDAVQTRLDRLNTVLQENIQGTEVIKSFVRQDHETERFDVVADDLAHQATLVNQLLVSMMPSLILVSSLGVAAVIWLGGNDVMQGSLSEGDLVAFISYMVLVVMPMIMFAFIQPMLSAAGVSMARIDQVLQELPEVPEPVDGLDLASSEQPGEIRFENVCFQYRAVDPDQSLDEALSNVSFRIPQGQTVAILGATGSGKSTLVHLIPRFYDTSSGTVFVGGVDVRQLSKHSLRNTIGIALQEPQLFSGSVMDNMRYGRPDAPDAEVFAAAGAAQADEFIRAMHNGYDSVIDQGGANLSGGQRQRIAIARTLLANPAILILDDSTSAVDLETEALIQDALAAFEDQTVVLVAQRISTALGADEIIVLDDGRVCAHGTHEELMETSEVYQEIYHSQLGASIR